MSRGSEFLSLCSAAGRYRVIAFIMALAVGGCATLPDPQRGNLASSSPQVSSCAYWFKSLDQVVDQVGVRDAGTYRLPGYPYLRVDRFLASFREQAVTDDDAFDAWMRRAQATDREARGFETANLHAAAFRELGVPGREQAIARTEECRAVLAHSDFASAEARAGLTDRARVPDDYSDWLRAAGLYGLTRIPFTKGVERWHSEAIEMFRRSREGAAPARAYRRYFPPSAAPATREEVRAILERSSRDRLGVPQIGAADLDRLFAVFAPVYEIETSGDYDRFGALGWGDSPIPEVDIAKPTVYRRLAFTRYNGATLAQLVFTIWFPERPRDGSFDMLAGRLDGIVLRVTLSPDGAVLLLDTIHPCGCYHMFFPTPLAEPKPAPEPGEEWAFIPSTLPVIAAGERVRVRIQARTHYLVDIGPDGGGAPEAFYAWRDENELRSLPIGEGSRRSIYGPDGLVAGTERSERMLFWPMGIASSGAMRQWGRHATAFVGRRHFDDADLIERRFSAVAR